jgi:hypothetical protein
VPGPRIHIPQEQSGPVIHPGTEFPFRRFIRLAVAALAGEKSPAFYIILFTESRNSFYKDENESVRQLSSYIFKINVNIVVSFMLRSFV